VIIIIQGLLETTREQDIHDFVSPILKGGFLQKSGEVSNITLVSLEDPETKVRQYHATLIVTPDPVADRVIKKLNSQKLKGNPVVVRQHHLRSVHNDVRENFREGEQKVASSDLLSQRKKDRRRLVKVEYSTPTKVKVLPIKPQSMKIEGFYSKGG